jgi:hypothetical protein
MKITQLPAVRRQGLFVMSTKVKLGLVFPAWEEQQNTRNLASKASTAAKFVHPW